MTISTISTKGQITLPADMRRKLKIKPKDRVVLEITGDSILIKKANDFFELEGFLGPAQSAEAERRQMEAGVAKHRSGGAHEEDIH